jgi:hypothetical protein
MTDARLDDDRLAAVLASVGEYLAVEGDVTAARLSASADAGRGLWRPLLVAAAVVAVLAGAVLAIAPARRAVGDWLGAGRIDVEVDRSADPAGLPAFTDAATAIDPGAAADVLGAPLPPVDGSTLGAPDAWWTVPEGGVLVSWADGDTTLWVTRSGAERDILKQVIEGQNARDVPDLGDTGFAVTGDHVLQTPHRRVRATSVVTWFDGGLTLRLDGSGDIDELIAIAHQLAR